MVEGGRCSCVRDGDARRGRMRNSLAMMVVVGWLVSYYVIVLVRGLAESTSCRGMARLGGDCTSFANGQGAHVGIISAL